MFLKECKYIVKEKSVTKNLGKLFDSNDSDET